MPFVASAILFWSGFLTVLSPLPLLFAYFLMGPLWALAAAFSNTALIFGLAGEVSFLFYAVLALAPAAIIPILVSRRTRLTGLLFGTVIFMTFVAFGIWSIHSAIHGLSPFLDIKTEIGRLVDYLVKVVPEANLKQWFQDLTPDEIKQKLFTEFPSGILIFALIVAWANIVLLFQMNPGLIRERIGLDSGFVRHWKTPEQWVWPTLLFGAGIVFGHGAMHAVALNGFKFMMAIYALQGLSILSFIFDLWNIRGIFRSCGYLIALFLMMPLILSLGFFDLWFDFRSKLRQS